GAMYAGALPETGGMGKGPLEKSPRTGEPRVLLPGTNKARVRAAQRSGLSPCRRWHELHLCRNIAARDEIRQPGLDNRPHIGPDGPVVVFLHRDDDVAAYLGVGAEGKDGDIDKRSAIDLSGNLPQSFLAPPAQ